MGNERRKNWEGELGGDKKERERESACVLVCACVCVCACESERAVECFYKMISNKA